MDGENDLNLANGFPTQSQTQRFSRKHSQVMSPADKSKLRRSYKELLTETAKYEEMELKEVDMNEFGKKIKKADRLFTNVDAPQEALLDAKVFKQIARISKNFIGQLSTNEAKFSNNVSHTF